MFVLSSGTKTSCSFCKVPSRFFHTSQPKSAQLHTSSVLEKPWSKEAFKSRFLILKEKCEVARQRRNAPDVNSIRFPEWAGGTGTGTGKSLSNEAVWRAHLTYW